MPACGVGRRAGLAGVRGWPAGGGWPAGKSGSVGVWRA